MFKEDYTALNQSIKASDELKARTLKKVYEKENNKFALNRALVLRLSAAAACLVLVVSAVAFYRSTFGVKSMNDCAAVEMNNTEGKPEQHEEAKDIGADSYDGIAETDEEPSGTVSGKSNGVNSTVFSDNGDLLSRKYLNVTYEIYCCNKIVGDEAVDRWVNDVYLKKSEEEREASPALYQAVTELNIERSQIEAYNSNEKLNGGLTVPAVILDAIYDMEFDEMKKELANPLALYYEGEVYTVYELKQVEEEGKISVPKETLHSFAQNAKATLIEEVGESDYDKSYKASIEEIAD